MEIVRTHQGKAREALFKIPATLPLRLRPQLLGGERVTDALLGSDYGNIGVHGSAIRGSAADIAYDRIGSKHPLLRWSQDSRGLLAGGPGLHLKRRGWIWRSQAKEQSGEHQIGV